MQYLHLSPAHARDEPRFGYGRAELDPRSEVEDRLNVAGQWFRYGRRAHLLNE
jgi:hypothetical protein